MTPTFHSILKGFSLPVGLCLLGLLSVSAAFGEVVSGRVVRSEAPVDQTSRGYVRSRITAAAESARSLRPLTVFLRVEDSLPLEEAPPSVIALTGLRLDPALAACAVDGVVLLENRDTEPATFVVNGSRIGPVAPGESARYECPAGAKAEEMRSVGVVEWPRARGAIYVAEVGAPGAVEPDGKFRISAARGSYTLRVIGLEGVLRELPVQVEGRTVDVGKIDLDENGGN